ncbi:peptidylprolyl isomerase [bacterium]|nr:MAG: peptidylprolyl isomerase [bacterium]
MQVMLALLLLGLFTLSACAQAKKEKKKVQGEVAVLETQFGKIILQLYDADAPKHTANFRKLIREKFYDSTTFHRVIPNFMIQGGDPNSKDNDPNNDGIGGPGYTTPAEIKRIHKRGALAAARQGDQVNPQKASSGSQFYIVHNGPLTPEQLNRMESQMKMQGKPDFAFTEEQRTVYTTIGGTPFLDGEYTVFGEVISGMDVVDKIAQVQRGPRDRPLENVLILKTSIETMEIEE